MFAYCGNNPIIFVDYFGERHVARDEFYAASGALLMCGATWSLVEVTERILESVADLFSNTIDTPYESFQNVGNTLSQMVVYTDADTIKSIQDTAEKYAIFECKQAAQAMKKQNRDRGNLVSLEFASKGFVISDRNPFTAISLNGMHYGYMYNGIVYCNVYPEGKPLALWVMSFHDASGLPPEIKIY